MDPIKAAKHLALTLFAVMFPQFATAVYACSCPPIPTPYEAFQKADAVFVGKVIGTKDITLTEQGAGKTYNYTERHFRFVITEMLKGPKDLDLEIPPKRSRAEPIKITVSRVNEPLKIVIPFPKTPAP